jgi:hypothetical protein
MLSSLEVSFQGGDLPVFYKLEFFFHVGQITLGICIVKIHTAASVHGVQLRGGTKLTWAALGSCLLLGKLLEDLRVLGVGWQVQ